METKFKPKFWRDIQKVKNDSEVVNALAECFQQVENSKSLKGINNLKKLVDYESRYRIKLKFDDKRNYRIGLYIHGNTVWFARFLLRNKIYEENW